jgi:hypothetical protein
MNWYRLFTTSVLFTSAVLPIAEAANAQVYAAPRFNPSDVQQTVVRDISDPHSFELFNNSQQDILYLHIYTDSNPDDVAVYGGIRQLPPGRAWKVNLGRECSYNVMAEYEDGSQVSYDDVNTCDYRGIQLQ